MIEKQWENQGISLTFLLLSAILLHATQVGAFFLCANFLINA